MLFTQDSILVFYTVLLSNWVVNWILFLLECDRIDEEHDRIMAEIKAIPSKVHSQLSNIVFDSKWL